LEDTCFRTKVALSALFLTPSHLHKYTETDDLSPQRTRQLSEQQIKLLEELKLLIAKNLTTVSGIDMETFQMELIQRRWKEMKRIVEKTMAWNSINSN